MTPTPEPAVGQVWLDGYRLLYIDAITQNEHGGDEYWDANDRRVFVADAIYLGTLDELREHQAFKRDAELWRTQVHTDNSAVIANLEAENAKLRAALKSLSETAWPALATLDVAMQNLELALTPTPHE